MKNNITKDPLFEEFAPLLEALNIAIVDVNFVENPYTTRLAVVIKLIDGEVGVQQCAIAHNLIKARMEVRLAKEQDFDLEVSTPGLQRKIRDAYEFNLFKNKRVRAYDTFHSAWFSGIISEVKESSVVLTNCLDNENNKLDSNLELEFDNISKAKLEYIWEDRKHGK